MNSQGGSLCPVPVEQSTRSATCQPAEAEVALLTSTWRC